MNTYFYCPSCGIELPFNEARTFNQYSCYECHYMINMSKIKLSMLKKHTFYCQDFIDAELAKECCEICHNPKYKLIEIFNPDPNSVEMAYVCCKVLRDIQPITKELFRRINND